jgi:hypothetical protein
MKKVFAPGIRYYIAPSAKPLARCSSGNGPKCRRAGAWCVVEEMNVSDSHAGASSLRWLCGEHALRWMHRETAAVRAFYRKHPEQGTAPIVGVSLKLPPRWADEDREASRELAQALKKQREG